MAGGTLVLGCRGMLGSDLVAAFGVGDVTAWDREELDVTNTGEVLEKISALAPEVIVNATGYTDVDGAEDNRAAAFALNDGAVKNIVQAAARCGATLVHFSTEYVFDGAQEAGYDEVAVPNPLSVYGESKAAGESYVINYVNGYLVRTSWLYGHTPQQGKPRGMNFVDTVLKLAAGAPEVRVVNDQFGKLTSTKDLAHAVVRLLGGGFEPGVYHLVNEGAATWYDVAVEAFRLRGVKAPLVPITTTEYPTRARRPQYAVLLNTKFHPLRPWQEALRDYLNSAKVS